MLSFFQLQSDKSSLHMINNKIRKIIYAAAGIFAAGSLVMGSGLTACATQTVEERLEIQRGIAIESNAVPNWPAGPVVNAESAILMELETGTILYSKNIHAKEYPASTTKILTTLIATEKCAMDEIVSFSNSAVFDTPRNSSHIAIDVGEELTMEQALNGILIASANEVSFAVAEHISGTWQEFANVMNQRAKELGCLNSNFVNPNGLPDDNHYTTAYDLAMIGRAFFSNELLCRISSSTVLRIPPTDKQPDDIIEYTRNQLLKGKKNEYEYLLGSKTGYTDTARNCLVSAAEKDGMKLVCVVMKDESPMQFEDTVSLFNYGFSNFEKVNVSQTETKYNIDNAGFFYSDHDIFGSSKPILSLNKEDFIVLPKTISFQDVTSSISYDTASENQAASITYSYNDVFLGSASVDLAAGQNEAYSFDTALMSAEDDPGEIKEAKEPSVIFINVVKVFLWIVGIVAAGAAILFVLFIVRNYQFAKKSNRRNWRRNQKRRQNRYQTTDSSYRAKRREQVQQARRRQKKAKRPNRFRDYDY